MSAKTGPGGNGRMEICKGFTVADWRKFRPRLNDDDKQAWSEAIGVFERRMRERFFRCIDRLLEADCHSLKSEPVVPGFSITALCCLLVETLQSFWVGGRSDPQGNPTETCTFPNGKCAKEPSTARAFKDFLSRSRHFSPDFPNSKVRGDFAVNVRNALLHEAETRGGWLIRRTDPPKHIVEKRDGTYILNRTRLYVALCKEFVDYLALLRDPSNAERRQHFLKKMDSICQTEPGIE